MVAAISAPKPLVWVSSCSTITLLVFATDASTASLSQGVIVRRSMISTEVPSCSAAALAASSAV